MDMDADGNDSFAHEERRLYIMKKVMSFVLAMILMAAVCAGLAESAPSKSTGDLTGIQAAAENAPEDSGFFEMCIRDRSSTLP